MPRAYDALINCPGNLAGSAAMAVIDALQHHAESDKGAQSVGLCAAFLLLTERLGLEPQDVFTVTKNLLAQAVGPRAKDFEAVRLYLQNEVHV